MHHTASEREPRDVHERAPGGCSGKLGSDRRERGQQPLPGALSLAGVNGRCHRLGQGCAGACDPVAESQDPDPATRKHVVQSRVIDGIGRLLGRWRETVPSLDMLEVRVDPVCRRKPREPRVLQAEHPMQKSARSARIDHKSSPDAKVPAAPAAFEHDARAFFGESVQARLIEIEHSLCFRFADEGVIEIGAVPMRIAKFIAGARRDQELALTLGILPERLAGTMKEEREASLQAAGDLSACALPGSPLREGPHAREVVPIGQFFQEKAGKRRRRLANREARVSALLDEGHPAVQLVQGGRCQGT